MAVYAVTYDLMSPGQDYSDLHEKLKSYAYSKNFESFWIIDTKKSASDIRDELKALIDSNDKLFVIEVEKHWASFNIPDGMVNWLKSDNRTF
ncbi:hypothetical protein CN637_03850 [Bacillus toyonensis]|uniref:hypothetical protein n=1 Tax=Bacillus toyonensis TaxID=155322 RepID=UPI000BF16786|nr:hypothetical protein [Bacillus toyonensis]PEL71142.1 hypothetical protein CN637_03850 [Bacillus toyonensis]